MVEIIKDLDILANMPRCLDSGESFLIRAFLRRTPLYDERRKASSRCDNLGLITKIVLHCLGVVVPWTFFCENRPYVSINIVHRLHVNLKLGPMTNHRYFTCSRESRQNKSDCMILLYTCTKKKSSHPQSLSVFLKGTSDGRETVFGNWRGICPIPGQHQERNWHDRRETISCYFFTCKPHRRTAPPPKSRTTAASQLSAAARCH